jgi:hypothetical protein
MNIVGAPGFVELAKSPQGKPGTLALKAPRAPVSLDKKHK